MFGKEKKIWEKKLRGKKMKGKKVSGFLFSTSMFKWKENERKGNRKITIFSCLFMWKNERKKKIMMPNNNFTLMSL